MSGDVQTPETVESRQAQQIFELRRAIDLLWNHTDRSKFTPEFGERVERLLLEQDDE